MPYVIPSPRGAGGVVGVRCDEPARPLLYSRTFGDAPLSHIESRNSQPKNLNLIPATFSTALKRAMVTTTAHVQVHTNTMHGESKNSLFMAMSYYGFLAI